MWNGEVHLDEVKSVELVKLTAEEKIKYIGVRHLFDKYIKIGLNNSSGYKYIYVSMYSNFQIKKIITISCILLLTSPTFGCILNTMSKYGVFERLQVKRRCFYVYR